MAQASPTQRADSRALLSSARHTGSRSTYNRSTSAVSESENNSLQRLSRDTTAEASVVTASCVTAAQDPGSAAQLSQRPAGTLVPEISSNPIPRCCLHGPSTPYCLSASQLGMQKWFWSRRRSTRCRRLMSPMTRGRRLEKHWQAAHQPAHPKGSPIAAELPDSPRPRSGMRLI